MAIRLAHIVVLATLGVSVAPRASAKTEVLRTRTGFAVHWIERDVTISIDASAPSRTVTPHGVQAALQAAAEAWNEVPGLPVRFRLATSSESAVHVRFRPNSWSGDLDDLGKATFTADIRTGVVASALVEINESDRRFVPPDVAEDGAFDLQAVLTHELGHVLGLGHSDDPNALMFSRGGTAGIRTPKADDRAGIALIYGLPALVASGEVQYRAPTLPSEDIPIERVIRSLSTTPANVPVLRVAGSNGRAMTVYTSEPTLLPPISPVEPEPDQRLGSWRTQARRGSPSPADRDLK